MNEVLRGVLKISAQGSIVIVVVLLVRLLLGKAPRKYICLLWILAGLRLLVPFHIESSLSLQPRLDLTGPVQAYGDLLGNIWIVGIAGMLFYSIVSYALLKWRLRESIRIDGQIWESDRIDTAFVLGYFQPRIYLPMSLSEAHRQMVLLHEQGHLKRMDHWLKLMGFMTLSVHWFNPVVWLGYVLYCWDTELACDEAVVASMDLAQRKGYSAALVACSSKRSYLTMTPVPFGDKPVRKRIRAVLNYREPGRIAGMVALVVTVILAVCFLTDPVMRK